MAEKGLRPETIFQTAFSVTIPIMSFQKRNHGKNLIPQSLFNGSAGSVTKNKRLCQAWILKPKTVQYATSILN